MGEKEKFDIALSLSTGAVVRVSEISRGLIVQFINPLIAPHDRSTVNMFNSERGRHTVIPMSYEAAEALMVALAELFKARKEVQNG